MSGIVDRLDVQEAEGVLLLVVGEVLHKRLGLGAQLSVVIARRARCDHNVCAKRVTKAKGEGAVPMARDMPNPAMMHVGAIIKGLKPWRSWNDCTEMRDPQPRSSTQLATGRPFFSRSTLSGCFASALWMHSESSFTSFAVRRDSGVSSNAIAVCKGRLREISVVGVRGAM